MPGMTGLAASVALAVVENKIPDVSNLVKKTGYDTKISDFEFEYFATADYNKFTN